jgi:pyrroloquinoline quinone biosynthesis protein D
MPLGPDAYPRLWRVARIEFDRVRQRPVILYPEGALFINDTARAILELCDGNRSVAEIAHVLGERYQADVREDVAEFLEGMIARGLVLVEAPPGADPAEDRVRLAAG